jgi:Lrp/AsnC family transcriptional regulator, regulator for asnA, asnC and gidA
MTQLDDLDRKIVVLLQDDGKRSNREIARILNTNEASVRRRVKRLLDEEIIDIIAVANPLKTGFDSIVLFQMQIEALKLESISEELLKLPELRFIAFITGRYDVIAEAWFKNNNEVTEFITNKLSSIEGILRIETAPILKMIKYAYDWGVDGK